jgi:hypothetical protein
MVGTIPTPTVVAKTTPSDPVTFELEVMRRKELQASCLGAASCNTFVAPAAKVS